MKLEVSLGPSGALCVHFEGHSVSVPCDERGARIIRRILRQREAHGVRPIANATTPIQYMVDQWLRDDAQQRADAISTTLTLEDLGI